MSIRLDKTLLRKRRRIFGLGGVLVLILAALTSVLILTFSKPAQGASTVSPLLWGENLELSAGSLNSDWFLNNATLRDELPQIHTQIIRMPVRGPQPNQPGIANWQELQQAALDVKSMGLTPLVILRNPQDPTLSTDDTQVVNYMNSIFNGPNQVVYYEWANETDLGGASYVSASTYVASWNGLVPQLKALAPNAKFIGPVNYQYDANYLQTFLQNARPLPDAISWHEYTCNSSNSESSCLSSINHWTNHFNAARSLMSSTIGKQLPIWITEWNFDPNVQSGDPKLSDSTFLSQWTTSALQTLANNDITASMHYNVSGIVPLVNAGGSIASEGQAFRSTYEALAGKNSSTPTPNSTSATTPTLNPTSATTPTGTPVPTATPTGTPVPTSTSVPTSTPTLGSNPPGPKYSFEDGGLDGWSSTGHVSSLQNSTAAGGQNGTHALQVTFTSTSGTDLPFIHANPSQGGPGAGQTLTAYVYVPPGTSASVIVKLYVQDSNYGWHRMNDVIISQRGSWQELSLNLAGYSGKALQVGVQFLESPANVSTTVYVDAVNWS